MKSPLTRRSLLARGLGTLAAGVGAAALPVPASPPGEESRWRLAFEDEFSGDRLDPRKWSFGYPWGGLTHNHRAFLDPSNLRVAGGKLVMRARRERHPDAPESVTHDGRELPLDYQSAGIHSSGHFAFRHGYAEARMKFPKGRGFWPAFWTLAEKGGWPPELDIMEFLSSDPHRYHVALHYGNDWRDKRSHGRWVEELPDLTEDFHDYGMHWTPDFIDFYFDGRRVQRISDRAAIATADTPMILILNLAIGGWERDPDESTEFEGNYFEIEHVRVWEQR